MYTLLSGLHEYLTRREEFYVIILGLDNAGKTVSNEIFILYFALYTVSMMIFLTLDIIRTN